MSDTRASAAALLEQYIKFCSEGTAFPDRVAARAKREFPSLCCLPGIHSIGVVERQLLIGTDLVEIRGREIGAFIVTIVRVPDVSYRFENVTRRVDGEWQDREGCHHPHVWGNGTMCITSEDGKLAFREGRVLEGVSILFDALFMRTGRCGVGTPVCPLELWPLAGRQR